MAEVQQARIPYVTFDKVAVEDRTASIEAGHYVGKDVVHAFITPAGSKDRVERVAEDWLKQLNQEVIEGRFPEEWLVAIRRKYDAYLKGEEVPESGTSIKEWPPASKAQVATLNAVGIFTVEDLAGANEETMGRLGMGGRNLVQQAKNWLEGAKDIGKLAAKVNELTVKLETSDNRIKELEEKLAASEAQVKQLETAAKK